MLILPGKNRFLIGKTVFNSFKLGNFSGPKSGKWALKID